MRGCRFQASSNAALHVGPLWVSQPFLVIIDPIVSVALSVWLFGERFTKRRPCEPVPGPGEPKSASGPRYQRHLARLDFRARTRCSAAWNAAWPKVPSW